MQWEGDADSALLGFECYQFDVHSFKIFIDRNFQRPVVMLFIASIIYSRQSLPHDSAGFDHHTFSTPFSAHANVDGL